MALRRPTLSEVLLLAIGGALGIVLVARAAAPEAQPAPVVPPLPGQVQACPPGGVLAFPGNGDQSDLLYVIDTGRQRICVYRWLNPGIRLVSARAYDFDMEVLDSAEDRNIEGRGATRGYVKAQVEAARRSLELKQDK